MYVSDPVSFRVGEPPAGWSRLDLRDATLAFRDERNDASVLINARCEGVSDAPLAALTNHLVMGTTERDWREQEVVPLDGREAMRSRLVAKLDGVPMEYALWVLKKDGCVYDFVYVAAPGKFEAGAAEFDRVVRAFRTLKRRG
jgi:hypothetical protein